MQAVLFFLFSIESNKFYNSFVELTLTYELYNYPLLRKLNKKESWCLIECSKVPRDDYTLM